MEWSTMMVSTYTEDSSRTLKVYQEHQQVGRVAHLSPTKRRCLRSEVQLSRDCADRFKRNLHGKTARSVLCLTVKVASARTSVRARSMFLRRSCVGGQ